MGTVVRAKTLCMEFGAKHFKEIIVRKDGVTALGLDLFREFVEFVVIPAPEGKKVDVDPETKNMPSTIEEDFTKIYNDMSLTDGAALLTGDKQPVRFHCAFVLESAPTLSTAISLSKDTSEEHREQMLLDLPKHAQLSAGAFRALLRFIYYADKSIEPVHAAELVPFARFYEIPALSDVVETIIKTGISVGSVIPILSLCYNKDVAKMVKSDVHNPSLRFVLNHFTEIDFKPLKKKPAAICYDILRLCKKQIEEGKWKRGDGSADDEVTGNESARESAREHASESEGKKNRKEKEPEDDVVVTKDALAPMRDVARGSSPRLSSRKPELVDTESAPNSPSEEPRRRRKVGKTKSLIEPSPKAEPLDMSLSYVPPSKEEKVSPVKKEKEPKTTDDIVPPAPSKSSLEEVATPKAAEEKPETPKSAEPAGESAEQTEVAKTEEKKPEEPKVEEKKEEPKPEEPKAQEKEEPKEEAKPADEAAEKPSKKDRKKKDDQPAEEVKTEAPAEPEKSSRKSKKDDKEDDKKEKSPVKDAKEDDSDSSRAAIRDKIKAFESQAKANAEEKLVRVPSQKNVSTATVKPKK
jgi:hypothetical protein